MTRNLVFLQLKKSVSGKLENGDFIFIAEASNENMDLEEQRVLQQALLDSKDYFLTNGIISKDHLHQKTIEGKAGNEEIVFDEDFVIGEPIKVFTKDGNKTFVEGKLYKDNAYAKKFIDLLKNGSTRVKASVGGLMPILKENKNTGEKEIVKFLWNDLALTIAPVNPTVSPVAVGKSLSGKDFVKALSAGHETDSNKKTGGGALRKEDIEGAFVQKIIYALNNGIIKDKETAEQFLLSCGFDKKMADEFLSAVKSSRMEENMALDEKKWNSAMKSLQKAIENVSDEEEEKDPTESSQPPNTDNNPEKQKPDIQKATGDDATNPEESDNEENDGLDATSLYKGLANEVEQVKSDLGIIKEGLNDLLVKFNDFVIDRNKKDDLQDEVSKSLLLTMQTVDTLKNKPVRSGSVTNANQAKVAKGGKTSILRHKQFTKHSKDEAMAILTKAVADGELSVLDCGKIETQINKSLRNPAYQLDQKFIEFLQKRMEK